MCLNSKSLLCNDSKCKLVKLELLKDQYKRIEQVEQLFIQYKKSLGINSFLDLNNKKVDKKL
jgi:hypothetical protein